MLFEQIYLGCLAQASYLIGDEGVAAVVDPRRDVEPYLEKAAAHGLAIRYVIETHVHADFVSGHRELAARTGAAIVYGRRAQVAFPHLGLGHGEELALGRVRLKVLETPGHTAESICLLLIDGARGDRPVAVLTGDTLFIGDVGRPDLLAAGRPEGGAPGRAEPGGSALSPQVLAGWLYDSLHDVLLALPDDVAVYPAHGAGSLCGRSLSGETSSTIGRERRFNYALQPMSRDQFVAMLTADLPELPAYFGRDAAINREGPPLLASLPPLAPLDALGLEREAARGAILLDTRTAGAFGAGHVPGSLNIGLDGQFASWAGAIIGLDTPIVLIADGPARAAEARTRLARVGIERVVGALDGGVQAWVATGRPVATLAQTGVEALAGRLGGPDRPEVLDVRRPAEWAGGTIPGASLVTLNDLPRRLAAGGPGLPPREGPTAVVCQGGHRSSLAASLLTRAGWRRLWNVAGGMGAWQARGLPVETPAAGKA